MKQKNNQPYKLWQEVAVLVAATKGYLDKFPENDCSKKIKELFRYMETNSSDLIKKIETVKEYTPEIENELKAVLEKVYN